MTMTARSRLQCVLVWNISHQTHVRQSQSESNWSIWPRTADKRVYRDPFVDLTTWGHWIKCWLIAAEGITSKVLFCFVTKQKRMKKKDGNLKKYKKNADSSWNALNSLQYLFWAVKYDNTQTAWTRSSTLFHNKSKFELFTVLFSLNLERQSHWILFKIWHFAVSGTRRFPTLIC